MKVKVTERDKEREDVIRSGMWRYGCGLRQHYMYVCMCVCACMCHTTVSSGDFSTSATTSLAS